MVLPWKIKWWENAFWFIIKGWMMDSGSFVNISPLRASCPFLMRFKENIKSNSTSTVLLGFVLTLKFWILIQDFDPIWIRIQNRQITSINMWRLKNWNEVEKELGDSNADAGEPNHRRTFYCYKPNPAL